MGTSMSSDDAEAVSFLFVACVSMGVMLITSTWFSWLRYEQVSGDEEMAFDFWTFFPSAMGALVSMLVFIGLCIFLLRLGQISGEDES